MNPDLPQTMLACLLYGQEDVRLERIPVPEPQDGELLVRVEAALTCGTDLKVYLRGYHEKMIIPPAVFGHEFAGTVVRSRHARFPVGSRVVAANSAPCGNCYFCSMNKPNLCRDLLFANGAYAEFSCIPARIVEKNCLIIPEDLPAPLAALMEPLACAVKGVEDAAVKTGETVLVIGAGPIGLMLARLCVLSGAEVTVVDAQTQRLAVAAKIGAAHTCEALLTPGLIEKLKKQSSAEGHGFDCVIEAVGKPETWNYAIELVRPAGRVNLFGGCPRGTELRVDTTRLHYDEIRIVASFHHTPQTIRKALEYLVTGQIPVAAFVGQGRSLADLPQVLQEIQAGSAPPKTAILPDLPTGTKLSAEEL